MQRCDLLVQINNAQIQKVIIIRIILCEFRGSLLEIQNNMSEREWRTKAIFLGIYVHILNLELRQQQVKPQTILNHNFIWTDLLWVCVCVSIVWRKHQLFSTYAYTTHIIYNMKHSQNCFCQSLNRIRVCMCMSGFWILFNAITIYWKSTPSTII